MAPKFMNKIAWTESSQVLIQIYSLVFVRLFETKSSRRETRRRTN